jgi:hypothetical protein
MHRSEASSKTARSLQLTFQLGLVGWQVPPPQLKLIPGSHAK